jgi:TonB family protein
MRCLWPSPNGKMAYAFAAILSLTGIGCIFLWNAVTVASRVTPHRTPLTQLEKSLNRVPAHISEFAPVSQAAALPKCGDVRPPEALLTPDPLLQPQEDDIHVRVSFIVGADGHVHSAFILDSGGPVEDQIVLRAIRFWRYRPALCNGVPTDFEALVRFTIR